MRDKEDGLKLDISEVGIRSDRNWDAKIEYGSAETREAGLRRSPIY